MTRFINILVVSILTGCTASAFYFHSSLPSTGSSREHSKVQQLIRSGNSESSTKTMASSRASNDDEDWIPTKQKTLDVELSHPRMAKDTDFANAVIKAWEADEADMIAKNVRSEVPTETRLFEYKDSTDGATLYGHLIRRRRTRGGTVEGNPPKKVPGVLLLHTGAGPHDISLQWKADSLVSNNGIFPDGCVVLVVDLLSDESGWGWSDDRSKYAKARSMVLQTGDGDDSGARPLLQSRLRAALKALQESCPEVDMTRLCALGWCLGGHSVLELGRMKIPGLRAMITFHGVFDGVPPPPSQRSDNKTNNEKPTEILICNGDLDPFVDKDTVLKFAISTLEKNGHNVVLLNLEGAKHGFSNPAQDYNPNPAFAYNERAASISWKNTLLLLETVFA